MDTLTIDPKTINLATRSCEYRRFVATASSRFFLRTRPQELEGAISDAYAIAEALWALGHFGRADYEDGKPR